MEAENEDMDAENKRLQNKQTQEPMRLAHQQIAAADVAWTNTIVSRPQKTSGGKSKTVRKSSIK